MAMRVVRKLMLNGRAHQERDEDGADTEPNEYRAECRNVPRYAGILARPSEPKDSHDERAPANHGGPQALLRRRETAPLLNQGGIAPRHRDIEGRTSSCADTNSDEYQAVLRNREPPLPDKDDWKGLEY